MSGYNQSVVDGATEYRQTGFMLFVQGIMGALQRLLARIPRDIRYRIISFCGIICLVTPLALWISMTIWGFQLILTVWFASMIVLSLMIWSSPDERI